MATCGTYQHTKAHSSPQDPSVSQVFVIHLKVHARSLSVLTFPDFLPVDTFLFSS